jgi:hypothetical protein
VSRNMSSLEELERIEQEELDIAANASTALESALLLLLTSALSADPSAVFN